MSREQEEWQARFNAESSERVHAQQFLDAQITKQITAHEKLMDRQLDVAKEQVKVTKGAARAAFWSAVAAIALVIVTVVLVAVAAIPLFWL